jgi:uncharacterized protein (UPF0147 family)
MYAFCLGVAPTSPGWTEIHQDSTGVHTLRKVAGASEPGGYLFDAGVGNIFGPCSIVALSGVDNVTPEDGVAILEGTAGGGQPVLTAPSITTKTDRAWHLVRFSVLGATATTISAPGGGYTEIVPSFGDPTSHDIMRVDARMIYKAGATSTVDAVQNDTATWSGVSYSIRPDSSLAQDPGPYAFTLEVGIDRITREDNLGVLITEESSPMVRALLTEDARGYIYLEDGSGVLLGDPGLFYAIGQELTVPSFLQKFYLHDATTTDSGTLPGASTTASLGPLGNATGATVNRSMDGSIGSLEKSVGVSFNSNLNVYWLRRFLSTPLAAGSYPSADWELHFGASDVSSSADLFWGSLVLYRPSTGAVVTRIIDFLGGTGVIWGAKAFITEIKTGSSFDAIDGDILIFEPWVQQSAGATQPIFYYDGTTEGSSSSASYLLAPFQITMIPILASRIITEDGLGVLLSEEFDTQPIFRSYDLETGIDRFLLENGTDILISEEPTPSFGSAVFVVAADAINAISDSAVRSAKAVSRTAADSIAGLSDAASRLVTFARTASDSIGSISDVANRLINLSRVAADSLGALSDSAVRSAQSFTRTASDSLGSLSDSANRLINLPRIASDSLNAITEATLTAKGVTRTAADTIGSISDSAVRSAQSFSRTASDTINALSDNAIRNAQSFVRTAADTISSISDSAVRAATNRARIAADSLGALSDSAIRTAQSFARTASDSLNALSDAVTRLTTAPRIATDTLSAITEATIVARGIARSAADSLSAISDSAIRAVTARARTADDVLNALSDTATRVAQNFVRTASDSLAAITESTVVQKGILRTATDTLSGISDAAVRAVSNKTRTASDSLNALSDTAVKNAQSFIRTAVDSLAAITESTTIARGVSRTASDAISAITDVATRITGRSLTAVDSLSAISDNAVRSVQSFTRTAVDSIGSISDTTTRLTGLLRTATDSISAITDSVTRSIGRFRTASDSLNAISDSTVRSPQAFARTAIDFLGNLIDTAISVFSALTRPFQDVEAITYSRDGIGRVYSRDGGVEYSRNGIGEIKSRDGGIIGSRDGIGVIKER